LDNLLDKPAESAIIKGCKYMARRQDMQANKFPAGRKITILGENTNNISLFIKNELNRLEQELALLQNFNDGNDFIAAGQEYLCPKLSKRLFDGKDYFLYKFEFHPPLRPNEKKGATTFNNCLYCLHGTLFISEIEKFGYVALDLEIRELPVIFARPACNFFLDAFDDINIYQIGGPCLMASLDLKELAQIKINIAVKIQSLKARFCAIHN